MVQITLDHAGIQGNFVSQDMFATNYPTRNCTTDANGTGDL